MKLWQIIVAAVTGLALLIAIGVLVWNFDPFGRRKNAEQKAADAVAQSTADQGTVQAVDHYTHDLTIIREKADHAERIIREAPGADAPLPPELRSALCEQLSSLRDGRAACAPADSPEQPAG